MNCEITIGAMVLWGAVCFQSQPQKQEEANGQLSQEAVIAWLHHQAGLVRTGECEFEFRTFPTRPEMVPLIKQACRDRGNEEESASFIYSEELAHRKSYVERWWRKGVKERNERFELPPDGKQPWRVEAFDSQFVRRIERGERVFATFDTMEDAHWGSINRVQPFSFLYEYAETPYWKIVANAKDFVVADVKREGKQYIRASFSHPNIASTSFILVFDSEHRLVQRDYITKISPDQKPRLYERHLFSDYHPHKDATGETIWFPNRADYKYYLGQSTDGTLVEYVAESMFVKNIKFNIPISDDLFILEMPKDSVVYDGVAGVGWINLPPEMATNTGNIERPGYWRTLAAIAVVLSVILAVLFIGRLILKRRSKNA